MASSQWFPNGRSWAKVVTALGVVCLAISLSACDRGKEGEKRQRERGVALWLVGLNPDVLSMVQRSSLGEVLGRERMHFNLEVAVARYLASASTEREM